MMAVKPSPRYLEYEPVDGDKGERTEHTKNVEVLAAIYRRRSFESRQSEKERQRDTSRWLHPCVRHTVNRAGARNA